jgi:hypothetical protein
VAGWASISAAKPPTPRPAPLATGPVQIRPLVVFGLCVMLLHLANAALLPLVGQKPAAPYPKEATATVSAWIVGAQAEHSLPISDRELIERHVER